MTQQTGVAVLGLGRWGVHWLRNFLADSRAQVLAVADPCPANLEQVDRLWQQSGQATPIYTTTDWQAAIAQPGITAVVVVTPATTHFELVSTALELGLHVLVEKPLTICPREAIALAELAARQDRILVVDHIYAFNPAIQAGANYLQSTGLGDLRYAYGTRSHLGPVRADVDVMWDLAIHDLVILEQWLGALPIDVSAKAYSWLQNGLADTVWATLFYPNGFEARMHWSWLNSDKQRRIGIVGSEGSLIFDELADRPLILHQGGFDRDLRGFMPVNQAQQPLPYRPEEPLAAVCQHFLDCIQRQQPSVIANGWQGAAFVQVLNALARSMHYDGARMPIEPIIMPMKIPAICTPP
jgi:predicted dehydrogenase